MQMTSETKTVAGYFGDKQVTKEEFIKEWKSHFGQFFALANTVNEFDELKQMQSRIVQLAGNAWEAIK
jgi:hypothetical protein